MQQQDARLSAMPAALRKTMIFKNIVVILRIASGLAIKITLPSFRSWVSLWDMRIGSPKGQNLVHDPFWIWKLFMLNVW